MQQDLSLLKSSISAITTPLANFLASSIDDMHPAEGKVGRRNTLLPVSSCKSWPAFRYIRRGKAEPKILASKAVDRRWEVCRVPDPSRTPAFAYVRAW